MIDSTTAEHWGLVNSIVPKGTALETAQMMVEQIAACSPAATREALNALRAFDALDDAASFEIETHAGATALTSGEVAEGIASFQQRRPANWS